MDASLLAFPALSPHRRSRPKAPSAPTYDERSSESWRRDRAATPRRALTRAADAHRRTVALSRGGGLWRHLQRTREAFSLPRPSAGASQHHPAANPHAAQGPCAPSLTARRATGSLTIVITKSESAATAAGDGAAVAPRATSGSSATRVRFQTSTRCPRASSRSTNHCPSRRRRRSPRGSSAATLPARRARRPADVQHHTAEFVQKAVTGGRNSGVEFVEDLQTVA